MRHCMFCLIKWLVMWWKWPSNSICQRCVTSYNGPISKLSYMPWVFAQVDPIDDRFDHYDELLGSGQWDSLFFYYSYSWHPPSGSHVTVCLHTLRWRALYVLHKAESRGCLRWVSVTRGAWQISHLLFVNDFFLFCQARLSDANAILEFPWK